MHWRALSFIVPESAVEAAADALMAAGALSVDVADADAGTETERAVFREPNDFETSTSRWARNRIAALFDRGAEETALRSLAQALGNDLGFAPQSVSFSQVDDQDWVRLTQSQFAPIEVDPQLWIIPTWHMEQHAAQKSRADAMTIVLDPGLAFGTGSHPTTQLCLRWLLRLARDGRLQKQTVIDYGCGSGILGIAAAKLGAGRVLGTDIDLRALEVAADNAMRNGVSQIEWPAPGALPITEAPIVVANILANPLCVLAPILSQLVTPGGSIALSGILAEQVDKVTAAYAPWIALHVEAVDDGWQLLTGRRAPQNL